MTTRRRTKNAERQERNKPITVSGKTENQIEYIKSIIKNDVIFCTGPSGSGKSFIAAGMAAEQLYKNEIEQIIVTRPLVSSGYDIGAMPGDKNEKIAPYLAPMEENLKHFLKSHYGQFINDGRIRYEPLELMRGATFNQAYMILDEAQNCTSDQIKMFITRMGEDSKVLINGDIDQNDLDGRSGLLYCVNKLSKVNGVGRIKLGYEDIQRNGIIGRILAALENHPVDIAEYEYDEDDDDDYYDPNPYD